MRLSSIAAIKSSEPDWSTKSANDTVANTFGKRPRATSSEIFSGGRLSRAVEVWGGDDEFSLENSYKKPTQSKMHAKENKTRKVQKTDGEEGKPKRRGLKDSTNIKLLPHKSFKKERQDPSKLKKVELSPNSSDEAEAEGKEEKEEKEEDSGGDSPYQEARRRHAPAAKKKKTSANPNPSPNPNPSTSNPNPNPNRHAPAAEKKKTSAPAVSSSTTKSSSSSLSSSSSFSSSSLSSFRPPAPAPAKLSTSATFRKTIGPKKKAAKSEQVEESPLRVRFVTINE